MSSVSQFLPHIINALSMSSDHQDNLDGIIKRVEEDLKTCECPKQNVPHDVRRSLQVGVDLGLIAANNNVFRLRFNPNAKPPFSSPSFAAQDVQIGGSEKYSSADGGRKSKSEIDLAGCDSQRTLNDDEDTEESDDEAETPVSRKYKPKVAKSTAILQKNECPLSLCMKRFQMNQARRRREARRRGQRSRSRSKRKRSKSGRRKRR